MKLSILTFLILAMKISMATAAPDFNKAVSAIYTAVDTAKNATADAVDYVKTNPKTTAAYAAAGVGAAIAVAPAIVVSPTLAVAGFTADGVAKGSIAACVQSGIGNVVAASPFATLQSMGAGAVSAGVSAGVSAVSGSGSIIIAGATWFKGRGDEGGNGSK